MNIVSKISIVSGLFLASLSSYAQTNDPIVRENKIVKTDWQPSLTPDGVIDRVEHVNRVMDKPTIREIDVAFKRRVWRVIDVRQKINQPFIYEGDEYSGGGAFIEILLHLAKNKDIVAYVGDDFKTVLDGLQLEEITAGTLDTVTTYDPFTGEEIPVITRTEFNPRSIVKYRVKEDWIMDRNRGKMIVEIVGIAPVRTVINPETGLPAGEAAMFWVYYPDARKFLGQYEVYNPRNDLQRMSWADFLDARYFDSYVYKTSANNPYKIEMEKGLRGLQEGERAMEEIYNKSMQMWEN
jgi:gliding motility associated protien GldN